MKTTIEIIIAIILLSIASTVLYFTIDTNGKVTYLHSMIQKAEKLPDNPK